MAITKNVNVDQITINEKGVVFYREAISFIENEQVLTQVYNRNSLTPGQDLTDCPVNVAAVCNAIWTPEVIASYEAK